MVYHARHTVGHFHALSLWTCHLTSKRSSFVANLSRVSCGPWAVIIDLSYGHQSSWHPQDRPLLQILVMALKPLLGHVVWEYPVVENENQSLLLSFNLSFFSLTHTQALYSPWSEHKSWSRAQMWLWWGWHDSGVPGVPEATEEANSASSLKIGHRFGVLSRPFMDGLIRWPSVWYLCQPIPS